MQNFSGTPAKVGVRNAGVQKVGCLKSKVAAFADASDDEPDD